MTDAELRYLMTYLGRHRRVYSPLRFDFDGRYTPKHVERPPVSTLADGGDTPPLVASVNAPVLPAADVPHSSQRVRGAVGGVLGQPPTANKLPAVSETAGLGAAASTSGLGRAAAPSHTINFYDRTQR